MRLRSFFLLLLFIPFTLLCQPKKLGKAPFVKTFNYVKLSYALTDGLQNDSDKVRSIFLWMTNNIRYGAAIEDPNTILLYRRAVCLGYSILFDSLCKIAGIQSAIVFGYAYEPWYEARDTLYLDNHAWNAVYLDGEWKLVDVTWSRGSLKMKRTPIRKFVFKLLKIPYSPRYKFKRKHNEKYYFPPPERMILDHYPSTAAWQLLECAVPIDSFQYSPYSTKNFLENSSPCYDWMDSITPIVTAPQYEQMVVQGKQAMRLNPDNHQDIAYGMSLRTIYLARRANDTLMFWKERIHFYDSAIACADSMATYFKWTAKDANSAGKFYMRRNKRMKMQTEGETKPLLRKQHQELGITKKARFMTWKQITKLKRENRRLRIESRSVKRLRIKTDRPQISNLQLELIRDKLAEKIDANKDLVTQHKDAMQEVAYHLFSEEGPAFDSLVKYKKLMVILQLRKMKEVNYYRAMGLTAFDTLVYTNKNQVLLAQKQQDSVQALMRDPGKWRFDSAYTIYKTEATQAKALIKLNMGMLKQMAKMPQGTVDEKAEFKLDKKEIRAINDSLIAFNKQRIREMKNFDRSFKKARWKRILLRFQLSHELQNEKWRFAIWNNFFKKYGRNLELLFRDDMKKSRELKTKLKGQKRALIRKVIKREKDHAKVQRKELKRLEKERIKELRLQQGN